MERVFAVILLSLGALFCAATKARATQLPIIATPPILAASAMTPVAVATATRAPMRMFVSAVVAANVRSGPSESFSLITTLPRGTEVQVYEVSGDWYKIKCNQLADYAWIHSSLLSEALPLTPVPTDARDSWPRTTPARAETRTAVALLLSACLAGILALMTSFIFPVWAALYASKRGHSGWAAVAVLSIFVGCGSIVGIFAWLASRSSPIVYSNQAVGLPIKHPGAEPEVPDDRGPSAREEWREEKWEREWEQRRQERQEAIEEWEAARQEEKEAEQQEWNEYYEQKAEERREAREAERQARWDEIYEQREEERNKWRYGE